LVLDGELPANSFRLGYVISQLWSRETNYAAPAQTTIGTVLGLAPRSVRRLIQPLVDRGHLEVIATGLGRGNASHYRPIIKEPKQPFLVSSRRTKNPAVP